MDDGADITGTATAWPKANQFLEHLQATFHGTMRGFVRVHSKELDNFFGYRYGQLWMVDVITECNFFIFGRSKTDFLWLKNPFGSKFFWEDQNLSTEFKILWNVITALAVFLLKFYIILHFQLAQILLAILPKLFIEIQSVLFKICSIF